MACTSLMGCGELLQVMSRPYIYQNRPLSRGAVKVHLHGKNLVTGQGGSTAIGSMNKT